MSGILVTECTVPDTIWIKYGVFFSLPKTFDILCPFAVYYLRYAVRSFFTLSGISLADGKREGQKIQLKGRW